MRAKAARTLAVASLLVAVASFVGAWWTPDWWEFSPAVLVAVAAGVLAAAAAYLRLNRLIAALVIGVLFGFVTFVVTLSVGCSRWCS
jgi:hypothetical protein